MDKLSKRLIVVAVVAVIALCGVSKTNGQTCDKWDLTGPFALEQANGIVITGRFEQRAGDVNGKGSYYSSALNKGNNKVEDPLVSGSIEQGLVDGNRVTFQFHWYARYWAGIWESEGVYEGTVADDGRVEGIQWDQRQPNNKVRWYLHSAAKCVSQTSQSGGGPPKPAPPHILIRPNPSILSPLIPKLTCQTGYVWRATGEGDYACVPPESRTRAAQENKAASSRRLPGGQCKEGFVWREAISDDHVCVTPEIRDLVREENRVAVSRAVKP